MTFEEDITVTEGGLLTYCNNGSTDRWIHKQRVKEAINKFADEDPLMMFEGLNWTPTIKDYFKKELGLD